MDLIGVSITYDDGGLNVQFTDPPSEGVYVMVSEEVLSQLKGDIMVSEEVLSQLKSDIIEWRQQKSDIIEWRQQYEADKQV